MKKILLLILAILMVSFSYGQCLVNSIVVNTGYDPITNDTAATGTGDPKWTVTNLTASCMGVCTCTPVYPAWVIPPLVLSGFSWATNPASHWISFYNGTGYLSTASGTSYYMTLTREFTMCAADSVTLNFQISNDNYITNLNVDGGASLFTQAATFTLTNFTAFTGLTTTLYLSAGTHTINVRVGNESASIPMNAHGLNIVGTVSSATGTTSIVRENLASCSTYVCSTPCNTVSVPDTIISCTDTVLVIPGTITGTDSVLSIRWSPATGLSDTTTLNPTLTTAGVSSTHYVTVSSLLPANLVVNGDFSGGNTGFSSSYTYATPSATALFPAGVYTVFTNPSGVHTGAVSFADHTSGTGNMLIVNGASTAINAWCQTITVTPYTDYNFSAWAANWNPGVTAATAPILQFEINGTLIGMPDSILSAAGVWNNFFTNWNSGASTTATICVRDLTTAGGGNDFVLDDITFQEICVARDTIYVGITPPDTITASHTLSGCSSASGITLTAPAVYTTHLWSTGSSAASINVAATGTYLVYSTLNCSTSVDTFYVTVIPAPFVNIGNDTSFCLGNTIVLTSPQPAGNTYLWNTGSTGDSITVAASGTYWLRVSNGCITTDTIHLIVSPVPVVDLGPDLANCNGTPATLVSSGTYSSPLYLWNTGATTPAITVTTSGTYWLKITDGGCSGSDTVNIVIVYDTLNLINPDTAICKGKVVQVIANINPAATCQWIPTVGIGVSNVSSPLITPDTTTMYHIRVFMDGCPVIEDSFLIDVQPNPTVYIGGNKFVCEFDTLHLHAAVNPQWYTGYSYNWSPATWLDHNNTQDVVYTAGSTQNYILTVATSAGCKGRDSAIIIVNPGNFATVIPDASLCPADSLMLTATGGVAYHWTPNWYLNDSTAAAPWAKPITTQVYTVTATSAAGCNDTLTVKVTVYPGALISLPDSARIFPGESYHIEPLTNCINFAWFPPSGLSSATISNPVATPVADTRYYVMGVTANGCKATDSIDIVTNPETLLEAPNAFTPGTGSNSTFKLLKRGEANLNHFRIYNRWGNVVFETKDIAEGWDGTFKGDPQPFGVYVYDVEAVTISGVLFKKHGNVTLLR